MKTLVVVMAHAAVQGTVDRHMPYWAKLGDVLISCPPDAMVRSPYPVLAVGDNRHNGPSVNNKFRKIISFMTCMDYDWFQFTEYDGITLGELPKSLRQDVLYANAFTNNGEARFKGRQYFHPPLTMGKTALLNFRDALSFVGDEDEIGFWDRLAGLACDRCPGALWLGYGSLGFARNTINPEDIPAAVEARRNGALFYHGVKSGAVLNSLVETQPMKKSNNLPDHGREL